ncbi:MAG: 50S ribosomal protein L23 [Sulfolobales archaeon]
MKEPTKVLIRPVTSEKSLNYIEKYNTLTFIADIDSTKEEIKYAVEKLFSVKVDNVRTLITPKGEKKAFIRLKPEFKASEVATKLGIL